MYPEELFDSLEFHTRSIKEHGDGIVLRLDSDLPNRDVTTEAQLYACLCAQLLEQQPNLILWVRHLYPNLRDAVIGSDRKWKTRCLVRCLRTLLLIPKNGMVYCLIHCGPVISQIRAVTQESEIAFRLLVSTEMGSRVDLNFPCTPIWLASEAVPSVEQEIETLVKRLVEHQPSLEPDKWTIFGALSSGMNDSRINLLTSILDLASLQSLPIFRRLDLTFSPMERISRCAQDGMPWVIPVVAWVKHAIRALSPAELKRILEIEWDKTAQFSIQEDSPSGEVLFVNLQRTLPELLWICGDTISLRQDFESFGEIWSRHHADRGCPDKYIANVCLSNLRYVFQNSAQKTQATGEIEAGVRGSIFDGVLSKYAIRYWMEYYSRAWPNLVLEDASFRSSLGEIQGFDPDAWARYLASTYWSSGIGEDLRNKALPHTLEQVFKVSLLESSYISYRIVTLPLSLEDDFDCLLLGLASEIVEEVKFYDMVEITCKDLSQSTFSGTLSRVIATASDDRRTRLFAAHDDFLRENALQILLCGWQR